MKTDLSLLTILSYHLPTKPLRYVNRCFMISAEKIIVKRGEVNINVVASGTGINLIHANDANIIRLPDIPTKINITL